MSGYEDCCGCGDYGCRACFGGDGQSNLGNAWMDRATMRERPYGLAAALARKRLEKYGTLRAPHADDAFGREDRL